MTLTIASANFYVGNKSPADSAKYLRSLGFDVAGIQEGHSGNVQGIDRGLGKKYKVILTGKSLEEQDVPVVVNTRKVNITKTWGRRISKRSQVKNIGMPRSATVVRFKHNGRKYRLINTHTNAAVQNRETKQPLSRRIQRVAEFVAGMIVLEVMIRNGKARGDEVILTGDLNYRTVKSGVWKFSPQAMFKRLNMKYKNRGLDYIAVTSGLSLSQLRVVDNSSTGSDHPWIFSDVRALSKAQKKRRKNRKKNS